MGPYAGMAIGDYPNARYHHICRRRVPVSQFRGVPDPKEWSGSLRLSP